MNRIRVVTEKLAEIAIALITIAAKVGMAGPALLAAGLRARTYERNTFGPQVRGICNEGSSIAGKHAGLVKWLADVLGKKQAAFCQADGNFFSRFTDWLKGLLGLIPPTETGEDWGTNTGTIGTDEEKQEYYRPVSPVSSISITGTFGTYFNDTKLHNGIDLDGKTGDAISSITPGEVIYVQDTDEGGLGIYVKIKCIGSDGRTYIFTYAHLNSTNVKTGDVIDAGANIGEMGATGDVTGDHLHLSVNEEGKETYQYYQQFKNSDTITPDTKIKDDIYGRTYKEEMMDAWVDPTNIVSGESELQFKAP